MSTSQLPAGTDRSETITATGDAATWLEEHGDVLYRYARSRVGHRQHAEDLVQDTMLAALQSRDRFEGRASVRTWLLSILRHKIIDHCRRTSPSKSASDGDPNVKTEAAGASLFGVKRLWRKAIASWKSPDQSAGRSGVLGCARWLSEPAAAFLVAPFILREFDDVEAVELRRLLELSEANLRVRLHRARLLLRECLEKHWFGDERANGPRRVQ